MIKKIAASVALAGALALSAAAPAVLSVHAIGNWPDPMGATLAIGNWPDPMSSNQGSLSAIGNWPDPMTYSTNIGNWPDPM
ncbi:hypothetical protein J2X01_001848 [Arthrobacter ginsengisoli]|uniref:Uncharacterized protein n=1 Tax=Arthrobacter ginsengisoli TaxID=1356565 RepID=A0ABU1UBH5_9MICC|nr:hypothetical protein [Arthrobacter ginsengisoli]MDR7082559.1 hypothetical protein [Arthrobacter ginsengisoli]